MEYLVAVLSLLAGAAAVLPGQPPRPGIPGEELTFPSLTEDSITGCGPGQFLCRDGSRCVPAAWRCDARDHCPDGSDELHCDHLSNPDSVLNTTDAPQCGKGQFRCNTTGRCIPSTWRCDGDADCGPRDDSDEDPFTCQKEFKCPNNTARCATPLGGVFECVAISSFCDAARDCRDGSDKWDICDNFTKSQCGPLKCAEGCRPTHEGLACYCREGYQPVNGKCEDLDECQQEAVCAQWCRNTVGSYTCACAPGYSLQMDGYSCSAVNDPINEPESLLVITQRGISRVWPNGHPPPKKDNLTLSALQVKAMDFDFSNKSFCYIHHNISRSGVVCVSVDDFSKKWQLEPPTLFPSIDSVNFMALDWISGAWYLVDGNAGAMFVCSRDMAHCRLLQDSLAKLRGLALDPTPSERAANTEPHGFMFWSVWGGSPARVVRTELWGGVPVDLVSERLVYPTALTLDLTNKWIYWVDAYMDSVERSDYEGKNRVTVFRGYESERVSLISNFQSSLYLPLWNNQSVLLTSRYARTHAHSPVGTHTQKTVSLPARVTAALVYHRQRQPQVPHPCASHNGGCTHICVTSWRGTIPRAHCLCRHGYRLTHQHPHQTPACRRVEQDSYLLVARGSPPIVQAMSTAHPQWETGAPAAAARPTAADVHVPAQTVYLSDVHRYVHYTTPQDIVHAMSTAHPQWETGAPAAAARPTAADVHVPAQTVYLSDVHRYVHYTTPQDIVHAMSTAHPQWETGAPAAAARPTAADVHVPAQTVYLSDVHRYVHYTTPQDIVHAMSTAHPQWETGAPAAAARPTAADVHVPAQTVYLSDVHRYVHYTTPQDIVHAMSTAHPQWETGAPAAAARPTAADVHVPAQTVYLSDVHRYVHYTTPQDIVHAMSTAHPQWETGAPAAAARPTAADVHVPAQTVYLSDVHRYVHYTTPQDIVHAMSTAHPQWETGAPAAAARPTAADVHVPAQTVYLSDVHRYVHYTTPQDIVHAMSTAHPQWETGAPAAAARPTAADVHVPAQTVYLSDVHRYVHYTTPQDIVHAMSTAHPQWETGAPAAAARPTAADVHVPAQTVYLSDVHRYEIVRQKLDGTGREVFIEDDVDNCEGLAIDWMGENLYWTDDALGQISVARLSDPKIRKVLVREPHYHPRSIALDPRNGVMYWSVWASSSTPTGSIETANMDGSARRILVKLDLHWPNGLVIQSDEQVLYWCDTFLNKIESLDLTTKKRSTLLSAPLVNLQSPYGLALVEGDIVWSEHGTGNIRRVSGEGRVIARHSAEGPVTTMRKLPPPLYDIRYIDVNERLGRNTCSDSNGGCSELCLATPTGRTCACAAGRAPPPAQPRLCAPPAAAAAPAPAPCEANRFHCGRGRCIDKLYVCDGDSDCPDGSDEDSSPTGPCANTTCYNKSFKCDSNRCIPKIWVCDGQKDCTDGSDESSAACANHTCGPDQFLCADSKRCIPAAWRCDGQPDCGNTDRSDEADCHATDNAECHPLMFRCPGGGCIPWEYYCDGRADCADGGDERRCRPAPRPEPAATATATTPYHEETGKNSVCEEHEFQCANKECIRMEFRCDYRADCLDNSDEADCEKYRSTTLAPPTPTPDECIAPALRCDNGSRCVPLLQLCDGSYDCADGADEADRCGEPMCVAAACTHECHPTPSGAVCACPAGLHLQRDGASCDERHVCMEWGVCSQTCQPQKNRHKCTCYEGYKLTDDGFTCKSTEKATPLLVFSNRHEVRAVELPSLTSRALISSLKNTVALDWKRTGDQVTLYWTDVVDDHIYSGTVQGIALSDIRVVIEQGVSTAEGLAVDWVGNNLYWVEGTLRQIEVARLDGRYRRTLISGDMESPRAIALDPKLGYLFWSDWEQSAPRIERCSMAGNNRTTIVKVDEIADGAWPNGITLDLAAQRLYWIDAKSDSIHTTLYDGTNYQLILRGHAMLSHPFAVTLFESHVYWTDWRSNSVVKANKWNGSDVAVVQRTMMQPFDIKVIHPSRQPALASNPCGVNNGNCTHLCLIAGPGARVCACPHVMRLARDNVTCEVHEKVVVVGRAGSIRGLDLDAPAQPVIPAVWGAQLAAPKSLATLTKQRLLYWSDAETNEIKRTRLTGGTAETIVETSGAGPGGALGLDWAARVLYYAARGSLWAAGPMGERASPLCPVANVTAIAVDVHRGKLYWAVSSIGDGTGARIEGAASDCSDRRVILDAKRDPLLAGVVSLTVEPKSGWLYWVNLASASIQYLDVKSGEYFTVELAVGARPLAMDVHFERLLWADGDGLRACALPRNRSQALRSCVQSELLHSNTEGVLSLRVYDAATQNDTRGACALRAADAGCAHLCLPVSETKSRCVCAAGYDVNGTQCQPEDEILVYSLSWEIRALSLSTPARTVLPPVAQPALCTALDYNADGDWIYWADSESGAVARAKRDGTERAALVSQPEPLDAQPVDWLSGLAVDWVARNIYWSDPRRNLVEVARANGDHRYVLIDTDPLAVTTLAVDAIRGWLFLSGGGWIQRARLDGSQRELLYNGTAVADIAIDTENEMVYWADTWDVSMWRMRYDGRGRVCVARGAPLRHPAAVALHNQRLYWIDTMMNRGSILSAPLTNLSDYKILLENAGDSLKDLFIWSKAAQTLPSPASGLTVNPCGTNNGGCAALCLWDGAGARCACPHGDVAAPGNSCTPYQSFLMYSRVTKIDSIHLEDEKDLNSPYPPIQNKDLIRIAISLAYWYDEMRLFYSDIQRGAIGSVHFNGTGQRTLLTKMGAVEGMVFEARTKTLYWTCNSAAVRRAHVPSLDARADNDTAQALVQTVIQLAPGDRPRGIDVDPCESRLYWTNWNDSNPRIQRAYSSGHELQTIISKDILMPNGLAIEHSTRVLYWADARLDKIERSLLDGSHRHIVVRSGAEHPFDVAACGGYVFWSDWVGRGILRADARGGGARALRKDLPRPMGLVCVTPSHQTCSPDPCSILNGGCAELCTVSSGGVVCACRPGRELNPDRSSCRPADTRCEDGQFACAEGLCIPEELVCDGVPNCGSKDASDEDLYYCTSRSCPADMTPCGAGGRCVRSSTVCDGVDDCDDGSDERCDCPPDQYRCNDGMCVPLVARCDGLVDCADSSDEAACPRATCAALGAGAAPCRAGGCYLPEWRCDGAHDCPDGSDELGCTTGQYTWLRACRAGGCYLPEWRCDGAHDCPDGSDELGCTTGQYTWLRACRAGGCYLPEWRCDGAHDCPDGSDELGCTTGQYTWLRACRAGGCYLPEWRCDGAHDCPDGSDELGCTTGQYTWLRACRAGGCYLPEWRCDGAHDCPDGSDELGCTTGQYTWLRACRAGGCYLPEWRCDGAHDCPDGSDELGCTTGQYTWLRACRAGGCYLPEWRCDGAHDCPDGSDELGCTTGQYTWLRACRAGGCYLPEWRCDGAHDCPDGSDELGCTTGQYTWLRACRAGGCYLPEWRCDGAHDCPDGSDELGCTTENADTTTPAPLTSCSFDQFTCGSAAGEGVECIPLTWRCDGSVDCSDGSDETLHCGHKNVTECTSEQFSCGNGNKCVPLSARCDGVSDCPQAEDEAYCPCATTAFRCAADKLCLHEGLYCDGDVDCSDGSDEPPGCAAAPPTTPAPSACPEPGALWCAGRCVAAEFVCDGRDHCGDGGGEGAGSDEDPFMCSSYSRATAQDAALGVASTSRSACAAGEWQCANKACVPRAALCDGQDHCGDFSDERRCNINECLIRNGGCAQNCTDLPVGYSCWCRAGYRRVGLACRDVDECGESACDHHCRNTVGSFVCKCDQGYRLMEDGVSCAPISNEPASLIFTNRYYIRRVTLDSSHTSSLLIHDLTNAVALDMEWEKRCLYWSDVARLGSSIKRACSEPGQNSSHYQLLHGATLQNPDGLAVDWVAGNVYWCDKGTDTLEVSRTDGTHRRVLIRTGLKEPRALALHPARGTIYWSDWGSHAHIGRAGMDGSSPSVIISAGLGWPNALVIAHASSELYFADAREDYIAVADLDGKHVRVLFSRDRMPWLRLHHVFALTVWEGRVYWSDWETRAIESCRRRPDPHYKPNATEDPSSGGAYDCKTIAHTVHKPMDLRVHHPARQPSSPELTALCAKLNCTGLCLLTPAGNGTLAGARCECPEHFVLGADGRSCSPNCTSAQFVCETTLKCIPFWWRCDTQDDCGDGSDEPTSCPSFRCSPGQFQCGNQGRCLHPALICDATAHCADGSDERDCDTFTCLSSQFKCAGNATTGVAARCVPGAARCDGARDCPHGDDELDCPPRSCKPDHFMCGDGSCVPDVWVCDADADCADGADEGSHCARRVCPPRHFRCASGRCIPRDWLCDSEADCPLREDEAECGLTGAKPGCEATYFRCADGRCIPGRWRCDFEDDCGDFSDEIHCEPRNCSESEFRCANGECIRGALRCSGGQECADGSDEAGCAPSCGARARPCRTAPDCVLHEWWCDGSVDCADGSDEESCPAAPVENCGGRMSCPGVTCGPAAWRCDGRVDCVGGADEAGCARHACRPPMFRCGNDSCLPPSLVCDGYRDCPDGTDENAILCTRRSSDSLCEEDEEMCGDGRCVPSGASCETGDEGPCTWRSCSQVCIPKHAHNYTCKCIEGYKHRQLPDNTWTCEASGEKAQAIVAVNGSLRAWELTKREKDSRVLYVPRENDSAEITSIAVGLVNNSWMVWWADTSGRMSMFDVTAALQADSLSVVRPPVKVIVQGSSIIRGVTFDWVSQRVYYTGVTRGGADVGSGRDAVGAVCVCAPDGRRRVTLARRRAAEPDDILVHNATRQIFWSDRGATPGIMAAGLDGIDAHWIVKRRVRRVTALALSTDRLYFVDAYYDVLESVKLDGSARIALATFSKRPVRAPSAPHVWNDDLDGNSSYVPYPIPTEACVRLAAWEDWVWCATRRGVARVARRGAAPARAPRALLPVSALAVLHPLVSPATANPCVLPSGAGACHSSTLCVRSASTGFACLCPDGLTAVNDTAEPKDRECVITPAPTLSSANGTCPLDCGPGRCVFAATGVPFCHCGPLYNGPRCQHYRCTHCHRHGKCIVAGTALKCDCFIGYTGERCETLIEPTESACSSWHCANGGTCHDTRGVARCICASGYTGSHCELCDGDTNGHCGPGSICEWTPAGHKCTPYLCQGLCQNQGTCVVSSSGRVSCLCPSDWSGSRCSRRACVDAACAPHDARDKHDKHDAHDKHDENDVADRFKHDDRNIGADDHDYRPHGKHSHSPFCVPGDCENGGRCVATASGARCECKGTHGGPFCAHYVGYGHACTTAGCRAPALCVWNPVDDPNLPGRPYCACIEGASCTPPRDPAPAPAQGSGGAWAGAGVALLLLLMAVLGALYVLRRRRHGAFVHARLSDNVEISNPMYLADDEPPRRDLLPPPRENGGNHFANPVYESMYLPAPHPAEEQNLLADASDSSPAERAALL